MTTNNHTEPGVCRPLEKLYRCPSCWQRFYFKPNLDYHMQRKHGTGQQPGVCRHGRPHGDDCGACDLSPDASPCTGQQAAQPDSGEAWRTLPWFQVPEIRRQHEVSRRMGSRSNAWKDLEAVFVELDRLQSALSAAKAYADDMEARYHAAHERLTAAQQRIAELERAADAPPSS